MCLMQTGSRDARATLAHLAIQAQVIPELGRQAIVVIDCLLRAFRCTQATIDALIGVDVEHELTFVKAVCRTDRNAVLCFAAMAKLGNDHWHIFDP